ncbi:hypothetical protein IMZ48_24470 [Candidatus Bathyarchaeota archaeon]|nr:hypothetical protein [Candidatus Bathyarchaeota archaeon]
MQTPDPRAVLQKDALETARWYRKQGLDRLRMISLGGAGLQVSNSRRLALGQGGMDDWTDGRDAMDLAL